MTTWADLNRDRYRQDEAWSNARRRAWGYYNTNGSSPSGPIHIGSKVSATWTEDLLTLGWKVAVLMDEENREATR